MSTPHEGPEIDQRTTQGREIASAIFVIPCPPGSPILVPGQVVSRGILELLRRLEVKEIRDLRPELDQRVLKEEALHDGEGETTPGG